MHRKCNTNITELISDINVLFNDLNKIVNCSFNIKLYKVKQLQDLPDLTNSCSIGTQIKYYRILQGLSQKELANLVNVSRDVIVQYESNEKLYTNLDTLNKIIDVLKIKNTIKLNDYVVFIMDNPSKKIIDIRNKNNLTRYDLAKKLNVVYGTVKRWELGKAQISQNCFNKLKKLMS